jgi:pimeloyl-ACP methyl ester carboxylesterase
LATRGAATSPFTWPPAHPERIGALVILDALGATGDGGQAEFGPALRAGLSMADAARLEALEAIEEPTDDEQREHLGLLWPQYFGDPVSAPAMPPLRFATNGGDTWISIQAHFEARTLEQALPALSVPTLIIHGSRSPIPLEQTQHMAALLPDATLVVHEGRGHWAWLEELGFVRAQLEAFLD